MTYQEIVDNFKSICSQHEIIREFGYGAISDIKTNNTDFSPDSPFIAPSQEAITLYPYVYLVPQQSTRTSQAITYRFNMIVMDTVLPNGLEILNVSNQTDQKDPPYGQTLKVQSDCQQYIDDILAQLRLSRSYNSSQSPLNYPLMDAQLNVNLTPFKERFQDTVAGMTATIEIEVAQPLNLCIAPIQDSLPELLEGLSVGNVDNLTYNYTNITNQWDIPQAEATYRIEWNFGITQNVPLSGDPSPNQTPKFTIYEESDGPQTPPRYLVQASIPGSAINEEVRVRGQVEFTTSDFPPDSRQLFFGLGYVNDYPNGATPTQTPNALNTKSGSIRIFKL